MNDGLKALEFAYGNLLKSHRKAQLIDLACREKGLTRCDANARSMQELCELLEQPYLPLCMLPKPSQRRPLPIKQWTIPKEYHIYIVMAKPYADQYAQWESSLSFQDDPSSAYHQLEKRVEQSDKSPKWKWVCSYLQKHPDRKVVVVMSPEQYRSIQPMIQACPVPKAVLTKRREEKAMEDWKKGKVNVLIVAVDRVPWMDLPVCTWVHFRPTPITNKRNATEHYYLHSIKSCEKEKLSDLDEWFDQTEVQPSLDLYRQWSADDDSDEEDEE